MMYFNVHWILQFRLYLLVKLWKFNDYHFLKDIYVYRLFIACIGQKTKALMSK